MALLKKRKNINEKNTPVYLFVYDKAKAFYIELAIKSIRGGGSYCDFILIMRSRISLQ